MKKKPSPAIRETLCEVQDELMREAAVVSHIQGSQPQTSAARDGVATAYSLLLSSTSPIRCTTSSWPPTLLQQTVLQMRRHRDKEADLLLLSADDKDVSRDRLLLLIDAAARR